METVQSPQTAILLVDDEPKNIQLLGNLLQTEGYAVEFATSGAEALQWVKARPFDLILLDVMMPEMDGYAVCKCLKNDPAARDCPVIFLTAKTDLESLVQGFNLGAVDYVTKPFRKEELLARVKTHLTLLRQQQALNHDAAVLEERNLELQQKNAQLDELNASKDKFFSILAHDLKNPFQSFLMFGNLFDDFEHQDQEQLKELIRLFKESAHNLFALLENLLTWSRLQRGLLEYLPQPLSIKDFAARNVNLLAPHANQKQIALHNRVPPNVMVYADLYMLDAVIRNLLSNAVKFTGPGGAVEISATATETLATVTVTDTGIGIPADKSDKLFRIDAKFRHNGTAGEIGTGLGLILCKEFVEKNGGAIGVKSEEGRGAAFFFTLPTEPR